MQRLEVRNLADSRTLIDLNSISRGSAESDSKNPTLSAISKPLFCLRFSQEVMRGHFSLPERSLRVVFLELSQRCSTKSAASSISRCHFVGA
jgi:hypothetical protein